MKKVILGTVLAVSLAMADATPKDDLLAMATMGKATGSQFEMNKSEMEASTGGGWLINYYYSRIYPKPFVDRRTSSNSYTRSYITGRTYSWSTSRYGGYTWMNY